MPIERDLFSPDCSNLGSLYHCRQPLPSLCTSCRIWLRQTSLSFRLWFQQGRMVALCLEQVIDMTSTFNHTRFSGWEGKSGTENSMPS
jgi:hypothetical protein